MDTLLSLLVKALVELFPELARPTGLPEEGNLELPAAKLAVEESMPTASHKNAAHYKSSSIAAKDSVLAAHKYSTPSTVPDQSMWNGNLDQNLIIDGIIFAEILQPPRAYRPFVRR